MTRSEVWLVSFSPTVGDEIQKTRPAVIISDDSFGALELRVVVPITAWQPVFAGFPWMVRLDPDASNGLTKASAVDAFQVKSVSTRRLTRHLGTLAQNDFDLIVEAVGLVIGHP